MDELNQELGIFEVKKHLSKLLQDVRHGGIITITHRGVPVAQIVPYKERRDRPMDEVLNMFRKVRTGATSADNVKDYVRTGRRY